MEQLLLNIVEMVLICDMIYITLIRIRRFFFGLIIILSDPKFVFDIFYHHLAIRHTTKLHPFRAHKKNLVAQSDLAKP